LGSGYRAFHADRGHFLVHTQARSKRRCDVKIHKNQTLGDYPALQVQNIE